MLKFIFLKTNFLKVLKQIIYEALYFNCGRRSGHCGEFEI